MPKKSSTQVTKAMKKSAKAIVHKTVTTTESVVTVTTKKASKTNKSSIKEIKVAIEKEASALVKDIKAKPKKSPVKVKSVEKKVRVTSKNLPAMKSTDWLRALEDKLFRDNNIAYEDGELLYCITGWFNLKISMDFIIIIVGEALLGNPMPSCIPASEAATWNKKSKALRSMYRREGYSMYNSKHNVFDMKT